MTTTTKQRRREWTTNQRRLAATGLLISVPVVVLVVWLLTRDLLQPTMTNPWSWLPGLDTGPVSSNFLSYLAPLDCALLLATLLVLWTGNWSAVDTKRRQAVIIMTYTIWFQTILFLKSMLISYGLHDGEVAQPLPWHLVACSLVAGFAIPLVALVLPPIGNPIGRRPTSGLQLAPREHILWMGRALSRGHVVWFATSLALATGLLFVNPPWAVFFLFFAVPACWRVSTRTIVDDRGVHVPRFLGWPTLTVPLDLLTFATASTVYGSWLTTGLTWENRKKFEWHPRSVVIRSGSTLVLHLTNGAPLLVSVDHPAEAADVVNALLLRCAEAQQGLAASPIMATPTDSGAETSDASPGGPFSGR